MAGTVRAAGGLVWQSKDRDRLAIVRRPRHGDWTLPKGKLEAGEDWLAAAVREVEEETGWRAVPGDLAGTLRYSVDGKPKEVRFWHMLATAPGSRKADGEVAEVRFVPVGDALRLLSHDGERDLLRNAVRP